MLVSGRVTFIKKNDSNWNSHQNCNLVSPTLEATRHVPSSVRGVRIGFLGTGWFCWQICLCKWAQPFVDDNEVSFFLWDDFMSLELQKTTISSLHVPKLVFLLSPKKVWCSLRGDPFGSSLRRWRTEPWGDARELMISHSAEKLLRSFCRFVTKSANHKKTEWFLEKVMGSKYVFQDKFGAELWIWWLLWKLKNRSDQKIPITEIDASLPPTAPWFSGKWISPKPMVSIASFYKANGSCSNGCHFATMEGRYRVCYRLCPSMVASTNDPSLFSSLITKMTLQPDVEDCVTTSISGLKISVRITWIWLN